MSPVRNILLAQIGVAALAGVAAWLAVGTVAGYSALLGGVICVLPNAYLALRMMAATQSGRARTMLNAAYWGEAGKLALTAALFAIAFIVVKPLNPGALLIGFVASQGGIWLAILGDKNALN